MRAKWIPLLFVVLFCWACESSTDSSTPGTDIVTGTDAPATADQAALTDSWKHAARVGLNGYFGAGVRLTLAYQALQLGDATLAPNYEPDANPADDAQDPSTWVHHTFVRAQWRL